MVVDTGSSKVFLTFPMSLFPDCISPDGITVGREEAVDAILRDRKLSYNKHTYQSPNLRVCQCETAFRVVRSLKAIYVLSATYVSGDFIIGYI